MKYIVFVLLLINTPAMASGSCAHAPNTALLDATVQESERCNSGVLAGSVCLGFLNNSDKTYLLNTIRHHGGAVDMGLCVRYNVGFATATLIDYPQYTE